MSSPAPATDPEAQPANNPQQNSQPAPAPQYYQPPPMQQQQPVQYMQLNQQQFQEYMRQQQAMGGQQYMAPIMPNGQPYQQQQNPQFLQYQVVQPQQYNQQYRPQGFFDDPVLNLEDPRMQQALLSPEQQQQQQQQASEQLQYLELSAAAMIFANLCISLLFNMNVFCGGYSTWLKGSLGIYCFDMIVIMNQVMYIKKKGRENPWILCITALTMVVNTSWYIYGNVLYFRSRDECFRGAPGLAQSMQVMVIISYCVFLKFCCCCTCAIILIPILVSAHRRANQPDWVGAAPQVVKNLVKKKYKESGSVTQEANCIICMVEYTESDDIVILPCNDKHYFHPDCIKEWLKKNNSCPLCKEPVTLESIKTQKKNNS